MQELHTLNGDRSTPLLGSQPWCVIIAGRADRELNDDDKLRSFDCKTTVEVPVQWREIR